MDMIMLICSSGGHLKEMEMAVKDLSGLPSFLVTYSENFENLDIQTKKVFRISNITSRQINRSKPARIVSVYLQMLINTLSELKIIIKERPTIMISTGSEIAIPSLFISKALGIRSIYIESLSRLQELSTTGRVATYLADRVFVQWESLAKKNPRTIFVGSILDGAAVSPREDSEGSGKALVLVGTAPFDRMISDVSEAINDCCLTAVIQSANSNNVPRTAISRPFFNYHDLKGLALDSACIISHSGVGSIMLALETGTPLIVFPRKKELGEAADNHQFEIADILVRERLALEAHDKETLEEAINMIKTKKWQRGAIEKKDGFSRNIQHIAFELTRS
jgi:beta-1,4-N-acetylglucosaminyltransferase